MASVANNITTQQPNMECRVCFDFQSTTNNPLISPCSCRGSVRFVHENCQRSWIAKLLQNVQIRQYRKIIQNRWVICELCHHKIGFQLQFIKKCKNREQIKQIFETQTEKKVMFVIIVIVIAIISLFCIVWFALESQKSTYKNGTLMVAFIIIIVSFLVLLIIILYLILKYSIYSKIVVGKISKVSTPEVQLINQGLQNEGRMEQQSNSNIYGPESRQYFWIDND